MDARTREAGRAVALVVCLLAAVDVCAQTARPVVRPQPVVRSNYQPVQSFSPTANPVDEPARVQYVAVLGAVRTPGVFRIDRSLTLPEAIEIAGGPMADATGTVRIVRGGRLLSAFYQPGNSAPSSDPMGNLLGGDVVILRPQSGIRSAHFETTASADRFPSMVQPASRPQLVHVACIGLINRPIVLPLLAEDANQRTLLVDILRLPDGKLPAGAVRVLSSTGQAASDDTLADGSVLLFDPTLIDVRRLRPIEPFPAAIDIPAAKPIESAPAPVDPPETPAAAPRTTAAIPQVPGTPFLVEDHPSAPIAITPAPTSVPAVASNFHAAQQTSPGPVVADLPSAETPPQPLMPPQAAGHLPDESLGWEIQGSRPVDVARPPAMAEFQTIKRGRHQPLSFESSSARQPIAPAIEAPTESLSTAAPSRRFDRVLPIMLTTCVAALAGMLIVVLWSRRNVLIAAIRSRRDSWKRPTAPIQSTDIHVQSTNKPQPILRAAVPSPTLSTRSDLDDLLENVWTVKEQRVPAATPIRLHGKPIGPRRMLFDSPHATTAGPHFLSKKSEQPSGNKRERRRERVEELLTAAAVRPAVESENHQPRTTPVYDVVQPETSSPEVNRATAPAASSPTHEDILARVLSSLEEGRR